MTTTKQNIRAFETSAIGVKSIVFATSRGAARYQTYQSANDAGCNLKLQDIEYAKRAKEFDRFIDATLNRQICYSPDYFEEKLK